MDVPTWVWLATIGGLLTLLVVDLAIVDYRPHRIRVAEAVRWVVFYVACAVVFGFVLWQTVGGRYAGEFFAGYITEYSLSVDNLFVFVIIMTTFGVPAIHQHKVLLFGIVGALVLRGLFIAAGAAVIAEFQWVFYGFGAFLLYTGGKLAFGNRGDEGGFQENRALRLARRLLPVTESYHGARTLVRIGGRRHVTPMLVVMIAIGTTDLLFALDSIPAIFGLTKEPFLVFTANAFALMGLRQLFFLLGGLLDRLVHLAKGLAVILGFIGVKLVLEAMAGSGLDWVPHVSIEVSLGVIVFVLAVTTITSLRTSRRDRAAAQPTAGPDSSNRRADGPAATGQPTDDRAAQPDRAEQAGEAGLDRSTGGRAAGGPGAGAAGEHAAGDPRSARRAAGDRAPGAGTTGDPAAGDQTSGDQAADDRAADDRALGAGETGGRADGDGADGGTTQDVGTRAAGSPETSRPSW
jgi:tellurite resistance protein TerC